MKKYRKNQIDNAESLDEFLKHHYDEEMNKVLDELLEMPKDFVEVDQ